MRSLVTSDRIAWARRLWPMTDYLHGLGGSGGAGQHRGGLGQEILIESRSETPIAVSFLAERTLFPAFGIEGGRDGAPGEAVYRTQRLTASYVHLYFASDPAATAALFLP